MAAAAAKGQELLVAVAKRGSGFSFAGDGRGSVDGDDAATAIAAGAGVSSAVVAGLRCCNCCCSFSFQDTALPFESWFRGAAAAPVQVRTADLAETSGRWLLLVLLVVFPPSLSFLFPIILMAGFLTSKKSSALNPIIARQIDNQLDS